MFVLHFLLSFHLSYLYLPPLTSTPQLSHVASLWEAWQKGDPARGGGKPIIDLLIEGKCNDRSYFYKVQRVLFTLQKAFEQDGDIKKVVDQYNQWCATQKRASQTLTVFNDALDDIEMPTQWYKTAKRVED